MIAGFGLIAFVLCATFTTTGLLYDQHYFYTGTFFPVPVKHPSIGDYTNVIYVKPYCRAAPYLVGLALGYIMRKKLHQRVHRCFMAAMSPRTAGITRVVLIIVAWITAAGLLMVTLYGLYGVVHDNHYLSHNDGIAYATFARFGWAIGLAWIIFACHIGIGSM